MPKMADRVRDLNETVTGANRRYVAWEDRYNVLILEDYALGVQKRFGIGAEKSRVTNKCGPTLLTKMPALMFWNPRATITPKGLTAATTSMLTEQCQIREDMVNSMIADEEDVGFFRETFLAVKEAHSRFGIVEVGYTGDYIDNPNAMKPAKDEKGEPRYDEDQQPVIDTRERILNPENPNPESIYVRRIPAATFRVSAIANNHLPWSEGCGYFEWVPKSDVEKNPYYKNRRSSLSMKPTGELKDVSTKTKTGKDDDSQRYKSCLKLWKWWDLREKKHYRWIDGADKFLVDGEAFDRLPFAWMRFDDEMDEWYPKPVMADWPEIQDEMNERRNQIRKHARRFDRRHVIDGDKVKAPERQKLESGEDGSYVVVKGDPNNAVVPIVGAEQDSAIIKSLTICEEDFREITRVGGEAVQNADSGTATQAQIKDQRMRVAENFDQMQVSKFLGQVVNLMLWNVETYVIGVRDQLKMISYSCTVDVESMSPAGAAQKLEQNNALIGILSNLPMLSALMADEFMLRRTLRLNGITSERDVNGFKNAGAKMLETLQLIKQQETAAKGGQAGAPGQGGMQADSVGAQPPPPGAEIAQQLAGIGLGPEAAQ